MKIKRLILFWSICGVFLIAGPVLAIDTSDLQVIQTEVSATKNIADKNTTDIQNMKGGLPAEAASRSAADADLQKQINEIELLPGTQGEIGPQGIQGPPGPSDPVVAELLAKTMDELCRLYFQTGQKDIPEFCTTTTPPTCVNANGLLWCYSYDTCGTACNDVCNDLGMNVVADNYVWFEAQNTNEKCAAISEAFGLGSTVSVSEYNYACIEDSSSLHDVPGDLNGTLLCSSSVECPQLHRTDMDHIGISCTENISRKSICPCE